jgi:hypothetical protein
MIGAQFASNVPLAQESFWMHPIVVLGDEAQVKAHFFLFGDSANLDGRLVHGLCRMYHSLKNHSGHTQWNS